MRSRRKVPETLCATIGGCRACSSRDPVMIAGLPWTAWLLLLVAVSAGLAVEIRFYYRHRRARRGRAAAADRYP